MHEGESADACAWREFFEETGHRLGSAGRQHMRRIKDGVDFTTFICDVEDEFCPRLNHEHDAYAWVSPRTVLDEMSGVAVMNKQPPPMEAKNDAPSGVNELISSPAAIADSGIAIADLRGFKVKDSGANEVVTASCGDELAHKLGMDGRADGPNQFKESDHPRVKGGAEAGQFTAGAGGS